MSETLLPLRVLADPTRRRETRDRLEVLTALLQGPHVEPLFREDLMRFPADHPVFGWSCRVEDCHQSRTNAHDLCNPHRMKWLAGRQANPQLTRREFLRDAKPAKSSYARMADPPLCRICPERPARHHGLRLCLTHHGRWKKASRIPDLAFEVWMATQTESFPGYGECLVVSCQSLSDSPMGLCWVHEGRYEAEGRPGGARRPQRWFHRFEVLGKPVPIFYADEAAFRHWCQITPPVSRAGTINLRGLPALVRAEFRWVLFAHTQRAAHSYWPTCWVQQTINLVRDSGVASLTELAEERRQMDASKRMILGEALIELRIVYFTPEETKQAGYIETEHFGVRFPQRHSNWDLTGVSQRWLRDLLWDYLADRLRSPRIPRSPCSLDNDRRACTELSAFLEVAASEGGHDPRVLNEDHMRRFVADHLKRAREGLPMLGIRRHTGKPSTATEHSRRFVFNHGRAILRYALDGGRAEEIGLSRKFIVVMPTSGRKPQRARHPFPDPVAHALADPANLQVLAERYDPNNHGLRDAWEGLVFTGRRCTEVLRLRLECLTVHRGVPFLWHDQTKVGNLDEAIRIPEPLYMRLQRRQQITLERFEDRHGRIPTADERAKLALFPSRSRNPKGTVSISYTFFHSGFSGWLEDLDIGAWVPHQARHTLATNLLKHGAGLHHIKKYLGHLSQQMTEHYAKVASSEIDDVLQRVWVSGPGSVVPGTLLVSPDQGLSQKEARAMALDLSRRSTPAEGGVCTFQPVVRGDACPRNLDCHTCDKFVMSGADLLYWRRKAEQWRSLAERAPDDATADYLHQVFEPTARAIEGLEKALYGLGLLDEALAIDLRRPQDYFQRMWSLAFRATDLAALAHDDNDYQEDTWPKD
ncbi:tyrosine-type recombinase/integrase [Streptomyces sp. NBC_01296]|uniref:tyrosine-type recombinase/integrase n=1 Tax=Streptomyces sp. NBC_01296 TaxID=2903816 RepID=UPI002E0EBEF6|nr:tyrosine-type recombinase/integrase [Streptomyces sp. NBC_01296]